MSTLEFSLSYKKLFQYGEWQTPNLSYKQKKHFIISGLSLFIIVSTIYLYFVGVVVSKNYERNRLSIQLQQSSDRTQTVEQQAFGVDGMYTAEYFIEHGYTRPKTLGIIKRTSNVAEAQISRFY